MKKLFGTLILFCSFLLPSFAQNSITPYKLGDEVSDFSLKNVDGKKRGFYSSSVEQGYIIVFTCNHCPYAKAYEDRIIQLHKRFAPQGYPVVAINPNDPKVAPEDSYAKMKERAKAKQYPFPYLFDETQEIAKRFGAARTPHVYVVSKNRAGKLILSYIGAIDDNWEDASKVTKNYVSDAVLAVQEGLNPEPAETKAIGCTIKWKK